MGKKREIKITMTEFRRHYGKYLDMLPKLSKIVVLRWGRPYLDMEPTKLKHLPATQNPHLASYQPLIV